MYTEEKERWQDKTVHRKTAFKKQHWKNIPIKKHSKGQNGPPKNTTSKNSTSKKWDIWHFSNTAGMYIFTAQSQCYQVMLFVVNGVVGETLHTNLLAHYSPYSKIVTPELLYPQSTHMHSLTYSGTKYRFFEGLNLWIVV